MGIKLPGLPVFSPLSFHEFFLKWNFLLETPHCALDRMQLWKKSKVFLEWLYKVLFHWTEFTAILEAESVIFRTGNVIKVLDKNTHGPLIL